jgi:hypothetical protein
MYITYGRVACPFKVHGEVIHLRAVMVFYKNRTIAIEIGFVAMVSFKTRNQQQIQISKKKFFYAPLNRNEMK